MNTISPFKILTLIFIFLLGITTSSQAMELVVRSIIKNSSESGSSFPVALAVIVIALVVIFTVLMIISPRGSSKRWKRSFWIVDFLLESEVCKIDSPRI
jgi:hypothetical protein